MSENDEYITRKMNVTFKKDEYQKYVNGEIHSDKGLRRDDGTLSSIPHVEEIPDEDENDFSYNNSIYNLNSDEAITESSNMKSPTEEILPYVMGGLIAAILILYDKDRRIAIKELLTDEVIPNIKKKLSDISTKTELTVKLIKDFFSGESKTSKALPQNTSKTTKITKATTAQPTAKKQEQAKEEFKKFVSQDDSQQQIQQIKILALLLSEKIKEFSNSFTTNDLTPDELKTRQNKLKELTSKEVINSIQYLVSHESLIPEESTRLLFREFLSGNIIVEGETIPLEIDTK